MHLWVLGVLSSVVGTFSSGLGDNLVRYSYRLIEDLEVKPPAWRRPFWVTGWLLTTIVDTGCNALALALASMSLIVPLGALHILWGSAFAVIINNEHLGKLGLFGAVCIVAGVVIVLLTAPRDDDSLSFDEVLQKLESEGFLISQAVTILGILACVTGALRGSEFVVRFLTPTIPGLFGSSSNLMLKITELLISSDGRGAWGRWEFWPVILTTVALAACQLLSLNHALANVPAYIAIPIANSVLLVGGTINGLVCFAHSSWNSLPFMGLGISICVVGIATLASKDYLTSDPVPEEVVPEPEEDRKGLLHTTQSSYNTDNHVVSVNSSETIHC
eukprot:TRINITY_DN12739_c0_g1_i1.p1 TRINITY_DN12739_c0_g1~~TRINITY_DN12739_c0_g1_i1.p1  ORF type:complete len:332 (+),score=25.91 TRINITY_DN12739_c0_g1_i1:62-1057(+)